VNILCECIGLLLSITWSLTGVTFVPQSAVTMHMHMDIVHFILVLCSVEIFP